ncbi:hypothetical protein, partial [Brachyspira hyodysenteriae]|uniref:hypothetical protein n=1 Tax=Brachyspira hyodysenteriae TaxID=159 RepID=UPI00063D8AEB
NLKKISFSAFLYFLATLGQGVGYKVNFQKIISGLVSVCGFDFIFLGWLFSYFIFCLMLGNEPHLHCTICNGSVAVREAPTASSA